MSASEMDRLLQQAIAHVNAGELGEGRTILERILETDPQNDRAWVWLSGCVEEPIQRRICLQQALRANPQNEAALDGVKVLDGELVQAASKEPSLIDSRLAAIGMGGGARPAQTESADARVTPVTPLEPVFNDAPQAVADDDDEEFELYEEYDDETDRRGISPRLIILLVILLFLALIVCGLVFGTVIVPLVSTQPLPSF